MVDDGKEHGDDRRTGDDEGSRHYEQRQMPTLRLPNGTLVKVAGSVGAVIFLIGVLMQLLGFRFTGSGADIKVNTADIAALQILARANAAAIVANTQSIAGVVATTVTQSGDIADIKTSLTSMMFVNCAVYTKVYEGAPTISECARTSGIP